MRSNNRSQLEIDCAVAAVTGDDVRVIRSRGFSLIDLEFDDFDPEPDWLPPQTVDWDELELSRNTPVVYQPVVLTRRVA
ncbi:MAG: hypothetical protein JWN70_2234 [Planctomycetaceae bacterium]|nr:hypothetical protein [Planctomycetaceae bacterium]